MGKEGQSRAVEDALIDAVHVDETDLGEQKLIELGQYGLSLGIIEIDCDDRYGFIPHDGENLPLCGLGVHDVEVDG